MQARSGAASKEMTIQTQPSPSETAIPQEMRAGVYRGNRSVALEHVPVPQIEAGEILIRVAACGICGTDVKKVRHDLVKPPQILGHEIAGTVVQVGAGVDRWNVGDRVVS